MLPLFDPETGRLPEGEHAASWDEVVDRFVFADFFKNERDGGHKGIVVLTIGGPS